MMQNETVRQIGFLEKAAEKMRAELQNAGSDTRRDALLFLIEDATKRVDRLQRDVQPIGITLGKFTTSTPK